MSFNLWPLSVQLNEEIIYPECALFQLGSLFHLIGARKLTTIWLKGEQMAFLRQQCLVD